MPLSAKAASVRIGSFVLYAKSWTVTPKTDKLDVTNFEGGGYGNYIGGIIDADISIDDMDWNAGTAGSIYDSPPNIQPTQIVAVTLYTALGGANWAFPNALVIDCSMAAKVRETVKIPKITLAACGSFATGYPTN